MPTRTYLTTPPGREPDHHGSPDGVVERWVPGLDLPLEPSPPHRSRTVALAVLVAVLAVLAVYVVVDAVAGARAEDPSLSDSAGQRQE